MTTPSPPAVTTPPFSPPSDCFNTVYKYAVSAKTWYQLGPAPEDVPSCYPANYTAATEFFYSPSVDCPVGYTTAVSNIVVIGDATETRATCCPTSSYVYQTDKASLPYYSTIGCTITRPSDNPSYVTDLPIVPVGATTVSGTTNVGAGMNAYSIEVRWQASDTQTEALVQTSSAASSAPRSADPTPILSSVLSSPSTSSAVIPLPSSSTAKSKSLSTGAKAGIAVLSTVAVIAFVAIFALLYRQRKRRLASSNATEKLPPYSQNATAYHMPTQEGKIPAHDETLYPKPAGVIMYGGPGTLVAEKQALANQAFSRGRENENYELEAGVAAQELPDNERR